MKTYQLFAVICFTASLLSSVQSRTALAVFNNAGVSGTVRFVQNSPEEPVSINVNLEGLDKRAGGYHVHELPVNFGGSGFQLNSFDNTGCGFGITADHFNPLLVQGGANNKESGPYLCSETEPEKCEAGDISGKFGSLLDLDVLTADFEDGNSGLTLFGRNSIIGRSMVIHRVDGSRLLCSNIFEESVDYKKVIATFDRESSGVEGTVTFLQQRENPSETVVFVNLELAADYAGTEASLALTVNSFPLLDLRNDNKFSRCALESTGAVAVDVTSLLGESLELKKGERTKILRTLTQGLDLVEKSLVLTKDDVIVDCSVLGKTARVEFTAEANRDITGDILFRQASETDPIMVSMTLEGLDGRANNYHVHNLPVFEDCLSTTGHFNPLGVVGGDGVPGVYNCDRLTPELCEAGDLSGRFGGLLGRNDASYTFADSGAGLTLFGENSIIGRSVVIHGKDGPSRLACANIKEVGKVNGQTASFSEAVNEVKGSIELTQRAVDADAETTITFNVDRVDGRTTERHMFHIHEAPVSESNSCSETLAHFSPSGVNGGAKQTGEYRCSEGAEFCEIGDISGKHALADLPNRFVLTDFTVPLSSFYSIDGLSITFHDEGGAPGRIDCANLQAFSLGYPDLSLASTGSTGSVNDEDDGASAGLVVLTVLFAMATVILAMYALQLRSRGKQTADRLSRAEEREDAKAAQQTL